MTESLEGISQSIRTLVLQEVDSHWKQTGRALSLPRLGTIVRKAIPQSPLVLRDGLKRFLDSASIIKIIEHPFIESKAGAVPLSAKLPSNIEDVFEPKGNNITPKLPPIFWRSFHFPILGRRFVVLSDNGEFIRVENTTGSEPEGRAVEILPTDVSTPKDDASLSEKVNETWEKINTWAARNNVDVAKIANPPDNLHSDTKSRLDNSLLGAALLNLSPEDQARIQIPLDLVIKMFR